MLNKTIGLITLGTWLKAMPIGVYAFIDKKGSRSLLQAIVNSAHPEMANLPDICVMGKFYPRNIHHMPAVKFFACLDLDQICEGTKGARPFLDGR